MFVRHNLRLVNADAPQLRVHLRTDAPKRTQRFAPACHYLSLSVHGQPLIGLRAERITGHTMLRRTTCTISLAARCYFEHNFSSASSVEPISLPSSESGSISCSSFISAIYSGPSFVVSSSTC